MGMEHGASAGIRRRSACRRPKGTMAPCGEGGEIGGIPSGPDVREESLVVVGVCHGAVEAKELVDGVLRFWFSR